MKLARRIEVRGGHFFTEDRKPNRTEPNRTEMSVFWFFGSASVFDFVYFGLRFRLRFSPKTETKYQNNRNICKPFPTWPKKQ
jgi:hypothetical protein